VPHVNRTRLVDTYIHSFLNLQHVGDDDNLLLQ